MSKLNWGVVGTGGIATQMGRALNAVNNEIYACCDNVAERAESYKAEFGVQKAYTDYQEMVKDENIDIIYIATPISLHYSMIMAALNNGKHVFCEKTITVNDDQLNEAMALAKEKGLVISDGITLLHMPLYKKLRDMINANEFGKVKLVQVSFGSHKEYNEKGAFFSKDLAGGALLDIGVYATAFTQFFMESKPNVVLSTAEYCPTGVDETSGILLKNNEGQMGVISLTMLAKQPKKGVIACEKGFLEIDNFPRAEKATFTCTETGKVTEIQLGERDKALQYEVMDMQDYVLNGTGGENLRQISNTVDTLTAVRRQWGMKYSCE